MRARLVWISICVLIPALARADGMTGADSDASHRHERFVQWTEARRLEDTVQLERDRLAADDRRQRQLDDIELRKLELRVKELEASRGAR